MQRSEAAALQLAAVASVAIRAVLLGPVQRGLLLGVSDHAAWIGVDDEVIVLSDQEAVRLPNALELAVEELGCWIQHDEALSIGGGLIAIGRLAVVPRRWFDPRPVLPPIDTESLAGRLKEMEEHSGLESDAELVSALVSHDIEGVLNLCRSMLGKGEGLTPEGDDLLAGAFAAYMLLAPTVDADTEWLRSIAEEIADLAGSRTTSFSAALVRHALEGGVAAPFASVLRSLASGTDLLSTTERLLDVGHTSGEFLTRGIMTGGEAINQEIRQ